MANPLIQEFQDIGYHEYEHTQEIPFDPDTESITLSTGETVLPVKPRAEILPGLNPKLMMKRIWVPAGQEMNDTIKRSVLREAKCLHYAKHRHVIRFETAFFDSENRPYMGIIMDRADGDIRSYLQGRHGRSQMSQMHGWFRCLASVVAYVHGLGITHRDIKPPNILIKDGKVFLADFGISKLALVKTIPTTEPNFPRGRTPQYAAPEVEMGSTRGRSTDIFSLGAVFLEMLVAHSYPARRRQLEDAKSFEGSFTYANRLEEVKSWIEDLRKEIGPDQPWQRMILRLCRDMMSRDRDERPDSEKVYRIISSTTLPNEPPPTCCLKMGEDDDLTPKKMLVEMCSCGNKPEVEKLLKQGVCPNTIGAIHQASAHGFGHVVEVLLKHGTDVNLRDYSNQTALHCASGYSRDTVARILLEKGANVDLHDYENRTPLFYASGHGNLSIVTALLQHRADVTVQDDREETALHQAARGTEHDSSDHVAVIRKLLQRRADTNAKDRKGRTPYDYAYVKGYSKRAELLGNDAPGSILVPDSALTESRSIPARHLAQIIQPPRQYSNDDIRKVSDQLRDINLGWEQLARIYIVLNIIMDRSEDCLALLKKFMERKITDYQLPIQKEGLVDILESPGARARFETEQSKVLTDAIRFYKPGEHYNISKDEWRGILEEVEVLGQGNSGRVYKVRVRETDRLYALKQIDRKKRKAEEELKVLKRVKHRNVISLVASFTSPNSIGLLMDPAADYNLAKYLEEGTVDNEKRLSLLSYFGCLVNALSYLHNEVYVRHNDIKPQNILVHGGRVLLADFGISLDWSETLRTTTWVPTARTPLYCAPEVVQEGRARNSKADIWSLGCVFLEMMTVLKGRHVNEIAPFFRERHSRSNAYNDNIPAVLQWIKILEKQDERDDQDGRVGNEPLEWIQTMLREDPDSRPSVWNLRQKLLEYNLDTISGLPIFGGCCRESTSIPKELDDVQPQEEVFGKSSIEEHTCIAAVAWSGEQRLYIQGTDGGIREATRKQRDSTWAAGKFQDVIATGKLCTPIVATTWQQTSGHGQPEIRLYFFNQDNYIQEKAWDPISGWTDGSLNEYSIKAAPSSELAVTSWGDGNIILFYQDSDSTIRMLHGWARKLQWRRGSTIQHAALPSPLAALSFEHLGNRGVRLFYKCDDSYFRELCWDSVENEAREDSNPYTGGYRKEAAPRASISALAYKQVDLEMFVYCSTAEGICENRYSGGWLQWASSVGNKTPQRSISATQLSSGSVRVYFIEGGRLGEVVRENGNWTQTFISGATCGSECPHRAEVEDHSTTLDSTLVEPSEPTNASQAKQKSTRADQDTRESSESPMNNASTQSSDPKSQQQSVAVPKSEPPHRSFFKRLLLSFSSCFPCFGR